jgi:hypothetical protein
VQLNNKCHVNYPPDTTSDGTVYPSPWQHLCLYLPHLLAVILILIPWHGCILYVYIYDMQPAACVDHPVHLKLIIWMPFSLQTLERVFQPCQCQCDDAECLLLSSTLEGHPPIGRVRGARGEEDIPHHQSCIPQHPSHLINPAWCLSAKYKSSLVRRLLNWFKL